MTEVRRIRHIARDDRLSLMRGDRKIGNRSSIRQRSSSDLAGSTLDVAAGDDIERAGFRDHCRFDRDSQSLGAGIEHGDPYNEHGVRVDVVVSRAINRHDHALQ